MLGNSISSTLLTLTQTSENNKTNEFVEGTCGMDYCPWFELEGTNTQEVPKSSVSIHCKYERMETSTNQICDIRICDLPLLQ